MTFLRSMPNCWVPSKSISDKVSNGVPEKDHYVTNVSYLKRIGLLIADIVQRCVVSSSAFLLRR
jgi:hypothetical protein